MIKIGMIIGGRYELLEKIGIGGTSEVYKVKDFKLNRFGAAKILKQEFSINGDFISKFRMEAQMAAGIMHPNIIDVYDAGEEDGIFYIVMGSVYYISPEQASGGAAMNRVISIRRVLRFLRCSQEGCLLAGKLRWILLLIKNKA